MDVRGNICAVQLTEVPENSVIEFIAQSSAPFSCNCNNNCNNIRVMVPKWPRISICSEMTKPEYRFVKNQNPIQVQFQSNVANIGSLFNLTYRGKITRTISCKMFCNLMLSIVKVL